MDADGLPLLGTGIDLHKVDPLNQKQTLAHINHFVVRTAQFLNKFTSVCEEKMEILSIKLRQLEISMNILEAKLSSIPGLDDVQALQSTVQQTAVAPTPTATSVVSAPVSSNQPADIAPSITEVEETSPQDAASQDSVPPGMISASQHNDYKQFFKLLQLGVPTAALKQKMIIQGLNPDLLDTPNALVPMDNVSKSSAPKRKDDDDDDDDDFGNSDNDSDGSTSD